MVADLSHPPAYSVTFGLDYALLASASSAELLMLPPKSLFQLHQHMLAPGLLDDVCDFSASHPCPFITENFRRQVYETIHGLVHPGSSSTQPLVRGCFVWSQTDVNVAIVGLLPPSCNYSYQLDVVNSSSRWPEAIPLTGITAEKCAWA